MYTAEEFLELAGKINSFYTPGVIAGFSQFFPPENLLFKELLNSIVIIKIDDFAKERSNLRTKLEESLQSKYERKRCQLSKLLTFAIDLVGCVELDRLHQILAEIRIYLQIFLTTTCTSLSVNDLSHREKVHNLTAALIGKIENQILHCNLPAEKRLDHAKECVESAKKVDEAVRGFIDASVTDLNQAGGADKPVDENTLVAQLNLQVHSLEQARESRAKAETNQANLEKEIADKQKHDAQDAASTSELDNERKANLKLLEENQVLKNKLDTLAETRKELVLDIKIFKNLIKSSPPLKLIMELLVLKRKIDLLHTQYSENRDKGQKYDLRSCYIFLSNLLALLTDREKQKSYLEDLKLPGYKDAEKALCKQFLEHLIAIAERGAKELGILGTQLKNQANAVEADPQVLKEFFAALEKNEAFIKQQTGLANEFYKVTERVNNNDFKLVIVEYGQFILDNLPQFEMLVDEELGPTQNQASTPSFK